MFGAILNHRMKGEPMGEITQEVVLIDKDAQVTMSLCPVCGQPIQAGKQYECEPVVLACIIDSLRSRCEELESERDKEHALRSMAAKNWHRVTMERDEAREWVRKLYAENANLRRQLKQAREATLDKIMTAIEADVGSGRMDRYEADGFIEFIAEIRSTDDADARDEALQQARNDALDEAAAKCKYVASGYEQSPSQSSGHYALASRFCAMQIESLKDNS